MMLFNPNAPAVPGDVRFNGGRLERYTLEGWQLLDTFRGAYEEGEEYEAGDVVIRGGAVWIYDPDRGHDTWACIAGNSQMRGWDA